MGSIDNAKETRLWTDEESWGRGPRERFFILRPEGTECSDVLKARKCLQVREQG